MWVCVTDTLNGRDFPSNGGSSIRILLYYRKVVYYTFTMREGDQKFAKEKGSSQFLFMAGVAEAYQKILLLFYHLSRKRELQNPCLTIDLTEDAYTVLIAHPTYRCACEEFLRDGWEFALAKVREGRYDVRIKRQPMTLL